MEHAVDDLIETVKETFLKTGKPGIILLDIYDCLVKKGELDKDEYLDAKVVLDTENRFYTDALKEGPKALMELARIKGTFLYKHYLDRECKRQAVANYFTLQNQLDNF